MTSCLLKCRVYVAPRLERGSDTSEINKNSGCDGNEKSEITIAALYKECCNEMKLVLLLRPAVKTNLASCPTGVPTSRTLTPPISDAALVLAVPGPETSPPRTGGAVFRMAPCKIRLARTVVIGSPALAVPHGKILGMASVNSGGTTATL